MDKSYNLKVIIFFTALTVVITVAVVFSFEEFLRPPFYAWVESYYPGEHHAQRRWDLQQRVEHFFISITVDLIVVTLLLRLIGRKQRHLVESEQRYRTLFEHANDGIGVVSTADFKLVEANNKFCEIFGCALPSLVGRDLRELLRVEPGDQTPPSLDELLGGSETGEFELNVRTPAGASLPVAISFSTLVTRDERHIILIIRDLSTRKRLEAEKEEMRSQMQARLAHNEKISALGRVAAQVAHEVKNPLAGLLLYSMHLKSKVSHKLPEGETALIDKIIQTINHLTSTTEQILNFARPLNLSPRPVELNSVVGDVLQLLQPQITGNKIKTHLELDPSVGAGLLDEPSLRSALMNLMLNAIQAMPDGGELTVATRANNGTFHMLIADTGCGMTPEQCQTVFEPFYTTKSQGLGLGMPFAQKVIEQHHGTIAVESRPGEGTRINVELPAAGRKKEE